MTINPINLQGRNYWYIRTDKGENYDNFLLGKFVAIGWNEITINDLDRLDENTPSLRRKVESHNSEGLEKLTPTSRKAQVTLIIKKNLTFNSMAKGDIVIIPSKKTEYLSFGIVEDNRTYNDTGGNCSYLKRRKVKWLRKADTMRLDAKFSYVTKSFHAISEIGEDYKSVINNYMFDSYKIGDDSIVSLKLDSKEPIHYNDIKEIIDGIISIGKHYSVRHGDSFQDIDDVEIQINLQSPGFISLKGAGMGLIFALSLLTLGCSRNPEDRQKYQDTITQEQYDVTEVDSLIQKLDSVDVNL